MKAIAKQLWVPLTWTAVLKASMVRTVYALEFHPHSVNWGVDIDADLDVAVLTDFWF